MSFEDLPRKPAGITLGESLDLLSVSELEHRVQALEAEPGEWAANTVKALRTHSPLMLQVTLEQIRRGATMSLADELRMERDMVRHSFNARHLDRFMQATDTMEGIRALVIDKTRDPRWNPPRLEDLSTEMVAGFFVSPWPAHAHPLAALR